MKNYIKPETKFVVLDAEDIMEPALEYVSVNDENGDDQQLSGKGMFQNDEMKIQHTSVWDK